VRGAGDGIGATSFDEGVHLIVKTLSLTPLVCSAAAAAALAGASTTQASDRANARHPSSCQRLKGHDLAPARSVKLYRRDGWLIGCVLPRGPIRHIAERSDIPDKSYSSFELRAVAGGFVLLDEGFNNAHINGTRTVVYHVRTAHQRMIATDITGDVSGSDDLFEAPVAFIDGRGRAVAALVSTKAEAEAEAEAEAPQVTIGRFPLTGGRRILDQGSAEDISPRSLTRAGNVVTWLHSGAAQSAPFA
jgi:hypothetical protein